MQFLNLALLPPFWIQLFSLLLTPKSSDLWGWWHPIFSKQQIFQRGHPLLVRCHLFPAPGSTCQREQPLKSPSESETCAVDSRIAATCAESQDQQFWPGWSRSPTDFSLLRQIISNYDHTTWIQYMHVCASSILNTGLWKASASKWWHYDITINYKLITLKYCISNRIYYILKTAITCNKIYHLYPSI